jgi:hypothetical protein
MFIETEDYKHATPDGVGNFYEICRCGLRILTCVVVGQQTIRNCSLESHRLKRLRETLRILKAAVASRRRDQRELNEARLSRSVINPLHRFLVIRRFGPEYTWHEGLWIAVVEREPARLDLHHNSVAF